MIRKKKSRNGRIVRSIADWIKHAFKVESDLNAIRDSRSALHAHYSLIQLLKYSTYVTTTVPANVIKNIKDPERQPKYFSKFNVLYKNIYDWWVHLLRCCYDDTYPMYRFFGAKGITMSKQFLDSKRFCMWAITRGLVYEPFSYITYIQRKNKSLGYTSLNCFIVKEKDLHECKDLKTVLSNLWLIKQYEEEHDESVSYMTFYTRYYAFDMDVSDAKLAPHKKQQMGFFSPMLFYKSVADENSVSMSTFLSRIHYSYLNGGHTVRPYEMLKPEYSVSGAANSENKLSYKQQYVRDKKNEKESVYIPPNALNLISNVQENDVYSENNDLNPYSK